MLLQVTWKCKLLVTLWAGKMFFTSMNSFVFFQVATKCKLLVTCEQLNGSSPVWILSCSFKSPRIIQENWQKGPWRGKWLLLLLPKNGFGLGESHKTLTQSLKFAGFSLKIACFFPKKFLLLPVSLTARFYYIKNLVAAFSSLVARFILFRVLLLPGSTVVLLDEKVEKINI